MLIIDEKTVYEIDEECLKKKKVKKECNLPIEKAREKKDAVKKQNGRWH